MLGRRVATIGPLVLFASILLACVLAASIGAAGAADSRPLLAGVLGGIEPMMTFGIAILVVLVLTALRPASSAPDRRLATLAAVAIASALIVIAVRVRYTKDSLGEDLIFRAAPPIIGGREVMGANNALEHGAQPSGSNNFQARYAIRHAWTGPIDCKDPRAVLDHALASAIPGSRTVR